jgi:hypothetical protein
VSSTPCGEAVLVTPRRRAPLAQAHTAHSSPSTGVPSRPPSEGRRLSRSPIVTACGIQIALGLIWLLAGVLQFQSFMYTHGIVTEVFAPAAEKQWSIVGGPMKALDSFYGRDLTL